MSSVLSLSARDQLEEARRLAASGSPGRAYDLAVVLYNLETGDAVLEAEIADCLADCCLKTARYELGVSYTRIAAAIWQTQDNAPKLAQSLSLLAEFLADIGAPDAVATAEQAIDIAERCGDAAALIRANMTMGLVLFMAREPDKALPFNEHAVTLSRQAAISSPVAFVNWAEALILSGLQAARSGDSAALAAAVASAITLTREALAEARQSGDGWLARLALHNIADYSMHLGDTKTAGAALAQVADTPGEPSTRCESHHLVVQARILAAQGEFCAAKASLDACLEILRTADYLEMELLCLSELATVMERMGLFQEALAVHRRYHESFVRMASEGAQRLARIAAYESETRALRDAAGRAQSLAASLIRSNSELAQEAERLLRATLEDALTGLPNRRRLELAMAALAVNPAPFACAMLDVDHFKQVNDRFSHATGDAVLRELANVFTHAARHNDLVVRFGGEEFALVVDTADAVLVYRVCERLRAGVASYDWQKLHAGLTVTVSIGMALSTEAAGPDDVLKLADTRLYEAKRAGRNRVIGPMLH